MENTNCFNFGGQDSMLEDTAGRNMTANPYDENSTYKKGAICIQNNKLYEANQNIDVAEQFTESHWTETTLGDIVSKNKSDIGELNEKMLQSKVISITTNNDGDANLDFATDKVRMISVVPLEVWINCSLLSVQGIWAVRTSAISKTFNVECTYYNL